MMDENLCEYCRKVPKVDGWKWCKACGLKRYKKNVALAKIKAKEGEQRSGHALAKKSLLDADADEQIGGASYNYKRLEDSQR